MLIMVILFTLVTTTPYAPNLHTEVFLRLLAYLFYHFSPFHFLSSLSCLQDAIQFTLPPGFYQIAYGLEVCLFSYLDKFFVRFNPLLHSHQNLDGYLVLAPDGPSARWLGEVVRGLP
jgi:hypothetical protein